MGLSQAVTLSWTSYLRILMVITDGPCHGNKYYDNISDEYPDRTIEEELDMIIKSKIFLIGIELPSKFKNYKVIYTKRMF